MVQILAIFKLYDTNNEAEPILVSVSVSGQYYEAILESLHYVN